MPLEGVEVGGLPIAYCTSWQGRIQYGMMVVWEMWQECQGYGESKGGRAADTGVIWQ